MDIAALSLELDKTLKTVRVIGGEGTKAKGVFTSSFLL